MLVLCVALRSRVRSATAAEYKAVACAGAPKPTPSGSHHCGGGTSLLRRLPYAALERLLRMERARARVQQLSEHVSAGGGHKSATQQGEGAAGAPVCLVVGAGPAIGAAVCRKFASQGWTV